LGPVRLPDRPFFLRHFQRRQKIPISQHVYASVTALTSAKNQLT
jgi:hypothetical protein